MYIGIMENGSYYLGFGVEGLKKKWKLLEKGAT